MIHARHYLTGSPVTISIENGKYTGIDSLETEDTSLPWIGPGLVDIQINGFGGIDFNSPIDDFSNWEKACTTLYQTGTTHFLATLITNTSEQTATILESLEQHRRANPFNCIGYHMEGPFLNPSPSCRGAHHPEWMTPPNTTLLDQWQALTQNQVKLVTLAPEPYLEESYPFIRYATQKGVRISLGHSEATGKILQEAVEAGATAWTHLGNAIPNPAPKLDNVLLQALACDKLHPSIIPDGHHIPPHAVKVMARALGERLFLTTDAMSGAGAGPGTYKICHLEITVGEDGLARHPETNRLAGSTLTPFEAVFKAADMSEKPWPELWTAMSTRPGKWLGLTHQLELGEAASFCLFQTEPTPTLQETWHNGQRAFSAN